MPYLERDCPRCGNVSEPMLSLAGPHIKATCLECGSYLKFVGKAEIPDVPELKKRIFDLAKEDMGLILDQKSIITDFNPQPSGLKEQLAYWKLYLNFI